MTVWKNSLVCLLMLGIFCMPVSAAACSTPYAYWKFDELGTPDIALDSSGNGFHGSVYNSSPTLSADVPNAGVTNLGSFHFDPNDGQAIEVDRPVQDDFTLCAWFKTTATSTFSDHWVTMPLFHSESPNPDNDFGFGVDASGNLAFGDGEAGIGDFTYNGTTPVNTGDWTHGCVTRERSTGEIKVYVNGILDASGIGSTQTLSSNPVMQIGYGTDGAPFWDGNIDEARVYTSVLSADEILAIANGNVSCNETQASSSSSSEPRRQSPGGRRGSTGNAKIVEKLIERRFSQSPLPAAATIALSNIQVRTCARVSKWFSENSSARERVNARLMKWLGFMCA